MHVALAFFKINIKMLLKDKLPFLWSIALPLVILGFNSTNIKTLLDLRFWWTYILISSYLFGIGIFALQLKESGALRVAFSIQNRPLAFFIGTMLTQLGYCLICLLIFNGCVYILFKFNFFSLMLYSIIQMVLLLPIAFLGFNITLLRKVHVHSLTTLVTIILFVLFMLASTPSIYNTFNPIIFMSNLITKDLSYLAIYAIIGLGIIALSLPSILRYSPISNEVR